MWPNSKGERGTGKNYDYVIREDSVTLSKIKIKLHMLERLDR